MRIALIVSAILHFGILAAMIITLPSPGGFVTPPVEALPVELVTIAEETDLTLGRPEETEVVETPAERTVEAEEPPAPEEQPGATDRPADRIAVDEDAIDSQTESAAPEPTGPPEPVEEPEPVVEPEPAPAEVAAVEPEEQQEAPPEPAAAPAPVPQRVVPQRKPTPPPRRQQTARVEREEAETFDADRLSQLINRTANTGGGSGSAQGSIGAATGRTAAALTMSEIDALNSKIRECWSVPIGVANAEELVISVIISFNPDGTVKSIDNMRVPGVGPIYDAAADSARRAVLQCQPYSPPLSPEKYELWSQVQVNFDPRTLF
jgi:hypothetical protein